MISAIMYGLTVGAILYLISVGFSLTFGTMRVINFAHTITYTVGAYLLIASLRGLGVPFFWGGVVGVAIAALVGYCIERFVIRRLYGESLDYTFIATFAVFLIGVDIIKWIWGVYPKPVSDPIGRAVDLLGLIFPVYRILVIILAILIFFGLELFMRKTMVGKVIVAALDNKEGVRCLGIEVDKYFTIAFVLGSALAALGGVLYAPITAVHPYMGSHILLLCFAVVLTGGLGNLRGTFFASFLLGMLISITGRFWPAGSEIVAFIAMALILLLRPIEA
ncbi:branched-chain amino acid ABC transporter permease [Candidatus Caldatribacterium sp.]|uniref:branched-chain amino acid ABC transporter permease n=1 Tax=Candidatus Caldatribacterium sp. TaxID=2282143 RepID=UPI003847C01F|nr:branched-chain amino acid ABC transporter permease [Candidatus Caldatribacterium sp.]